MLCCSSRGTVDAAGDKQGAAGAGAVDDVDGVVLVIIHFRFSINARAALAALTHPSHVLNVRSRGFPRLPPCSDANCFAKTKECGHFTASLRSAELQQW